MKTAIIVHGMPSKKEYLDSTQPSPPNAHWLPWIQRQLILNGVLAQTPEMPEPYEPDYQKWSAVFDQFHIDADTLLVGHSCGAGFLVRWLSEHAVTVGKVALVAPWLDPTHVFSPKMFDGWQIDESLAARTANIKVFISTDDDKEQLDSVTLLKEKITGIEVQEFTDKGHFCFNHMKTQEFSELKDLLVK